MSVVVIPSSETSLVADLIAGQGDIAANLLRTFERDDQVAFAKPWRTGVRELVVTGPGTPPLVSLEDVGGRTIHVRRNSDHHASLLRLNDQLKKIDRPPARMVVAAESQTDEDLLELVNSGRIPATLVDDYLYDALARDIRQIRGQSRRRGEPGRRNRLGHAQGIREAARADQRILLHTPADLLIRALRWDQAAILSDLLSWGQAYFVFR